MVAMKPIRPSHRAGRSPQRGDIMLVTMVFLLMCMLGLVVSLRDSVVTTTLTGNNLARQKDVQVGDIALRMLENNILTTYNGASLRISAYTQPWYRDVQVNNGVPPPPDASYWTTCAASTDPATRCAALTLKVNGVTLPYTALAVVQPTGRSDSVSCEHGEFRAEFYDLFVYVKESNGATAANTETVYRLCTI